MGNEADGKILWEDEKSVYEEKTSMAAEITGIEEIDQVIENAGYSFDPQQEVFYPNLNSWQRNMGYSRLYDEAAVALGMILDSEPIYFEYNGKKWLIQFWKGQYALATGCEIGVYTANKSEMDDTGIIKGTFYNSANDEELLQMKCNLKKRGETILERSDKHWWLAGFKLGEFSQPHELTMNISITCQNREMCNAFLRGLAHAGYTEAEIIVLDDTVSIEFTSPRTRQPMTRMAVTDQIIQIKNRLICHIYNEITGPYSTFPEKIRAIQDMNPWLFKEMIKVGKTKQIVTFYNIYDDHLEQ